VHARYDGTFHGTHLAPTDCYSSAWRNSAHTVPHPCLILLATHRGVARAAEPSPHTPARTFCSPARKTRTTGNVAPPLCPQPPPHDLFTRLTGLLLFAMRRTRVARICPRALVPRMRMHTYRTPPAYSTLIPCTLNVAGGRTRAACVFEPPLPGRRRGHVHS